MANGRKGKRLEDPLSMEASAVSHRNSRKYPGNSKRTSYIDQTPFGDPSYTNPRQKAVQETVIDTFERIGGVAAYAEWAENNRGEFYGHYIKILPLQIKASIHMAGEFTSILEAARSRVGKQAPLVINHEEV